MCENVHEREQWQLLQGLRSTVEELLVNGLSNVWNVYGGLNRLHHIMEQIFKHGCRVFNSKGEPDCWTFIQGLNWLQPSLATTPTINELDDYMINLPARIVSQKDTLWLYKSLENHSLSQKLSWLLSDKEHLLSCLEPWAFLCQETLAEATLICLRAIERNQPALLTEIDPCLFLPMCCSSKCSPKRHRRSSSYPINLTANKWSKLTYRERIKEEKRLSEDEISLKHVQQFRENERQSINSNIAEKSAIEIGNVSGPSETPNFPLKQWNSLPTLNKNSELTPICCNLEGESLSLKNRYFNYNNSNTNVITNETDSVELSNAIKVDYPQLRESTSSNAHKKMMKAKSHVRKGRSKVKISPDKKSNSGGSSDTLNYDESVRVNTSILDSKKLNIDVSDSIEIVKVQKPKRKTSILPGSAPEFSGSWGSEIEGQKDIRKPKKSFMEDGGSSVQPMATGYFPRPIKGQSLTSFLSSAQFSSTAELDRENAHFSISEAMIAAIEQVKCNRQLRLVDETIDESDEEINNLKRKIRLRRRQRQEERCRGTAWNRDLLSDGKTDTTTTDQSVSPLSTSSGTPSDSLSTDDVEDSDINDVRNMQQLRGISASMASLYSEAENVFPSHTSPKCGGSESTLTESTISAEGVALSLISRFNEKQLPRASELKWLVSEQDAPQQLLPLPKNWSVSSPEEVEAEDDAIALRGTIEWAPPRRQIIFTPHPTPMRKTLIAKQNYRCAGCGMKVAVEYAKRFRYCEYLGRYFCTGCHTNQVALIPGKILSKWDFNRYPVSNFSYRLLDQMTVDPLFQVNDLNALLYRRIKMLDKTRILRTQLFILKDFLFNCRLASSFQQALREQPGYIINDPHTYSMQDFINVKVGLLPEVLSELVETCCAHISKCVLCQARGFVCEICYSKDVIFPWEFTKVTRCEKCGACFHKQCEVTSAKKECSRCIRLRERRMSREDEEKLL